MVWEVRRDYASEWAAMVAVAKKVGIGSAETLRKWSRQMEIDSGVRAGVTSQESADLRMLRAENRELRRANEIFKAACSFFRGGARPPTALIVEFIDQYQDRFGVEPRCVQLSELGCAFAPSPDDEARGREPSARALRDEQIKELMVTAYDENYRCYGARTRWRALRQAGHQVARGTVERLRRQVGLVGARRGKTTRTTIADPAAARAGDLVGGKFAPGAPNRLGVADVTSVSTMVGWVSVAFVIDAYARRVLGWEVAVSMTTDVVLAAIEQAIFTRKHEGVTSLVGLIHHHDYAEPCVKPRKRGMACVGGVR